MMSAMEHTTASQPPASEPQSTYASETGTTKRVKAHGDRNFRSLILPELVSVPLFYEWLRKPFRRKDTSVSR
jgi:hypothetical protein